MFVALDGQNPFVPFCFKSFYKIGPLVVLDSRNLLRACKFFLFIKYLHVDIVTPEKCLRRCEKCSDLVFGKPVTMCIFQNKNNNSRCFKTPQNMPVFTNKCILCIALLICPIRSTESSILNLINYNNHHKYSDKEQYQSVILTSNSSFFLDVSKVSNSS